MNLKQLIPAGISIGLLCLGPAASQPNNASVDELIEKLVPKPLTRSLKVNPETRGIKIKGRRTENASLNLYVNFEYDSDQLRQDTQIILDQLGDALSDGRLSKYDFLIAGHTDAVGSDAYNRDLSERRAISVKNYLVSHHGISSTKLIEKGFGESRLLKPESPNDGSNRRVQIITLSIPEQ